MGLPGGPGGGGGPLPPSFGGPFASLGGYMAAAAAAAAAAQAVRKPFDGPGSPLMPSSGAAKMGGMPQGFGPMSAHPALRHFFAAAAGHGGHPHDPQGGFLSQGLHPAALAASLAAAGHAHSLLPSPPTGMPTGNENGAPSFQSVLASLSAYRPRPAATSSPSTSPTSSPLTAGGGQNLSSSPDFSTLLKMQQPNLPSLAAAVARSLPNFVPQQPSGGSTPPPPPSPTSMAAAMAAMSGGRSSNLPPHQKPASTAADSLNALRLKAREHELRMEMIKKMES